MTFSFFHLYGLILGVAIWAAILLVEKKAQQYHFSVSVFWLLVVWEFVTGIIGARLYHVGTDFALYKNHLWQIFFIWQGGLSILGAVLGGAIGLWLYVKLHNKQRLDWRAFIDLSVFGIPFGQAIGRLGNYFNQELYGAPTTLPWGIYIDPAHRIPGYINFSHFHPLFFYELILMFGFGVWVWWADHQKKLTIGSGQLFFTYLIYYMFIRFWLDFLRIDKVYFASTIFSLNQVILFISFVGVSTWWFKGHPSQSKNKK